MTIADLPAVNATLNGISLTFIILAIIAIKAGKETVHRYLMGCAILSSTVFLVCYLVYHFGAEAKKYAGDYAVFYYGMLITHVVLAALVPIMVVYVVWKIWKNDRAAHRKVARIAAPIWIYVSLTGILIFYMVHT